MCEHRFGMACGIDPKGGSCEPDKCPYADNDDKAAMAVGKDGNDVRK